MWRFGLIAFAVGAITALTVTTLPDPDPSDHTAIAVIAGVLALSAASWPWSVPTAGWAT